MVVEKRLYHRARKSPIRVSLGSALERLGDIASGVSSGLSLQSAAASILVDRTLDVRLRRRFLCLRFLRTLGHELRAVVTCIAAAAPRCPVF